MACLSRHELVLLGLADGGPMPFAEPGIRPNYAPSWTVRPTHADLRLSVEPEQGRWEGEIVLRFEALVTYEGSVRIDLEGPAVLSVGSESGEPLPWRSVEGGLIVEAGSARGVRIAFAGSRPGRGLYVTGPTSTLPLRPWMAWTQCQDEDAHAIFPCFDHPRVRHPWRIRLEGPAGSTLLSNGAAQESGEDAAGSYAIWEQAEPMPAYLFTAVVGPLEVVSTSWRDRSVRYLVPPGEGAEVERAFGRTPEMMEVFSTWLGVDYPWSRYDQVVVHEFVFGGMENTACTSMTDALLVDARTGPHWDPEGLVCHELAHQWFGDLVTCQDWGQGWLNESWATFLETVWAEHRHGAHEAAWYAFGQQSAYLDEDGGRYRRPIVSYLFKDPIDVFDRHLYEKGAVVLRTLRHELGDGPFRAATQAYLQRHAHGGVHTRDLQRVFEEVTGRNLDAFFAAWIHGAGHPVLRVELGEEAGLLTVSVSQGQEGDLTPEAFPFSLVIDVVTASGSRRLSLPIRERERVFAVPVEEPILTVRVDPGFRVLADVGITGPLPWLSALAMDDDPVLATRALRALAKRGGSEADAVVDRVLQAHPFWGVRGEAAAKVGARGTPEAEALLRARLREETEPRAWVSVVRALAPFRSEAVADDLIASLSTPTWTWYQLAEALETLGRSRLARAIPAIHPHLTTVVPGDVVRTRALLALALTEQASVLPTLLAFSRDDVGDRGRFGAAKALGALGDKVPEVRAACRERLEEMARAGGFRERYGAVQALGVLRDPAATATLSHVHASDRDGRVRRSAWEALWRTREGRTGSDALLGVRDRLETVESQARDLKQRLDRHEGS